MSAVEPIFSREFQYRGATSTDSVAVTLPQDESLIRTEINVTAVVHAGATTVQTPGTLHITNKHVIFLPLPLTSPTSPDYILPFRTIVLHAMSRDTNSIYCQLDNDVEERDDEDESEQKEAVNLEKLQHPHEIRFVLKQAENLPAVYESFCSGAVLNPDSPSPEDEEAGEFFTGAVDESELDYGDADEEQGQGQGQGEGGDDDMDGDSSQPQSQAGAGGQPDTSMQE